MLSADNAKRGVQKLWREVGAMGPNHDSQFGIECHLLEATCLAKWLDDVAFDFTTETDFPFHAIGDAKPEGIAVNVSGHSETRNPGGHASGSIRGKGLLAVARLQMSASYRL